MKKTVFNYFAIASLALSAALTSCNDDAVSASTITMTTAIEGDVRFYIAGSGGRLRIDWGDGTKVKTYILKPFTGPFLYDRYLYTYNYSTNSSRTITITGKGITHLNCVYNRLTSLDVSKNTALTYLSCWDNRLTSLDISKNTALKELYCFTNQLTSLDVSKNTALTNLECGTNQLTSLDVSKNTALKELYCGNNPLTSLDLSENTALIRLYCWNNPLTSLDLSENTALIELYCVGNQLTAPALNALFESLHSNDGTKSIAIWDNPGASTCDQSIATNKGWKFWW